ncbi:zinc ribbon domain-containing protein [Leptolyngbya sp. 15MV]|nr:zinc ribbon domain-containing protein [Leptolyngbya sp. 15MV]
MGQIFLLWLIIGGVCAAVCFSIAGSKGLNDGLWGLLGFFIGPLAILFVAIAKPDQDYLDRSQSSSKKKCPTCAEFVQAEALKCRFCGTDFNPEDVFALAATRHSEAEFARESRIADQNRSGAIALAVLGGLVLLILGPPFCAANF